MLAVPFALLFVSCERDSDALLIQAEQYGRETAAVRQAVDRRMDESDSPEAAAWRRVAACLNPVRQETGISWDPSRSLWDISSGGKGLLFGRYLIIYTVRFTATTNLTITVASEPTVSVSEIMSVTKQADGRYYTRFTTNNEILHIGGWNLWAKGGFTNGVAGFPLITNRPVAEANFSLE